MHGFVTGCIIHLQAIASAYYSDQNICALFYTAFKNVTCENYPWSPSL